MTTIETDIRFSIVPEWVLDGPISDRAVRVYALLARYADSETLQAFPSRETLAKRANCHWRSIDRAIDELVVLGAVKKTHRKNGEAYQSNVYTLRRVLPLVSLGTDTPVTGVLTPQSVGTDTGGNLTITTELEPEELEPLNKNEFDMFWSVYPLKREKPKANRAFEKAAKRVTSIDIIVDAAVAYRDDPNRDDEFTKYPATWLNNDCWDDGPLPERKGKTSAVGNALKLVSYYQQIENERKQIGGNTNESS
jgi:hypothetical protein